jgi:predicted nucleic acid-binding protein
VIRVTLDTNEYVSAFQGGAKASQLMVMGITGQLEIAISDPIITEVIRVLRDKFQWPPNARGATYYL